MMTIKILLWAMGCDEFLAQAVAASQGGIAKTGKNEPIVRSKREQFGDTA